MMNCICDEILEKTEKGSEHCRYREEVSISWDCPKHGKVSADFRHEARINSFMPAITQTPKPTTESSYYRTRAK